MSNAASIFNGALALLKDSLGDSFQQHTNIFELKEESARKLENGFGAVLLKANEISPQNNAIFLERELRVKVTFRTYASSGSSQKVATKLEVVYDNEKKIIDAFRAWRDPSIGLIKVLPQTDTEIEQGPDDEDDFLTLTLNFKIQYFN